MVHICTVSLVCHAEVNFTLIIESMGDDVMRSRSIYTNMQTMNTILTAVCMGIDARKQFHSSAVITHSYIIILLRTMLHAETDHRSGKTSQVFPSF